MKSTVPLTFKVFTSLFTLTLMALLILTVVILTNLNDEYRKQLVDSSKSTADLVATMSSASLIFEQKDGAESILSALDAIPEVTSAVLYFDADGEPIRFAEFGQQDRNWVPIFKPMHAFGDDLLQVVTPVSIDDLTIGWLHLQISLAPLNQQINRLYLYAAIAVFVTLLVVLALSLYMTRGLLKPLVELQKVSSEIASTKDYRLRVKKTSSDEIGRLVVSFNTMLDVIEQYADQNKLKQEEVSALNLALESKVEERTKQLNESLEELSLTVNNLKNTQHKVIEQEKMASLGSLVAGVAHEVNTPLGIAVTMSSAIGDNLKQFLEKMQSSKLTRRDLEVFAADSNEGFVLLQGALQRAASLINSFKQVAVDQTSEERRRFVLRDLFTELLNTLHYQIKHKSISINLDVPELIELDSFPGPLGQVFTNLFNNAVIHGFDNKQQGTIDISATIVKDNVVIEFADDGVGIPEDLITKIYDPFMTTKLGQGGSGLGLNIVRNIVINILGGEIKVRSEVNRGSCFTLTLPIIAESRTGKANE